MGIALAFCRELQEKARNHSPLQWEIKNIWTGAILNLTHVILKLVQQDWRVSTFAKF